MIWYNNGNGTYSPYMLLEGKSRSGKTAESIELIYPKDLIGCPMRRNSIKIIYNDKSSKTVSDIDIIRGKSDLIKRDKYEGKSKPDLMTLPRGSLVEVSYVQQWKGPRNRAICPYVAVGDFDKDGKNEVAYTFWPDNYDPFPTRMVIFECVNQNTYRIDWDTTLGHGGSNWDSKIVDFDSDGNLEFFGIGWNTIEQSWEVGLWECTGEGKYKYRRATNIAAFPQVIDVKDSLTLNNATGKGFYILFSNPSPPPDCRTSVEVRRFVKKWNGVYEFSNGNICPSLPYFTYSMQAGKFDRDGKDVILMGDGQIGSGYIDYLDSVGTSTNSGYEWKTMIFSEPVCGGHMLGKDFDKDGHPDILVEGIGINNGSLGVVKHTGAPGENQWQVMWWDTTDIKRVSWYAFDTLTWNNKFTILNEITLLHHGPYYTRFFLNL